MFVAKYVEYYERIMAHHDPHHPWQPRFVFFCCCFCVYFLCFATVSHQDTLKQNTHKQNTHKQNTHKHTHTNTRTQTQQIVKFWGSLAYIMAIITITMAIITITMTTMRLMKVPKLKVAKNYRCLWYQQVLNQSHQGFVFFFFFSFSYFSFLFLFFLFC